MSGVVCCGVCLSGDLRLSCIESEQLHNIFEKLTNNKVTQETLTELKIQPIEVLWISDKRRMHTVDIVHTEEESYIKDEVSIKVEEGQVYIG